MISKKQLQEFLKFKLIKYPGEQEYVKTPLKKQDCYLKRDSFSMILYK